MQTQEASTPESPAVTQPGNPVDTPVSADTAGTETPLANPEGVDPNAPAGNEDPVDNQPPAEPEKEAEGDPDAEAKQREEDFSRRFAALTRKEREFLARERQVKELESKYGSAEQALKNIKENPMEALQAAGWTFKELAEFVVNDNKLPEGKAQQTHVEKLEAKIAALEEKLTGREKQELEAQQQQYVDDFKGKIKSEVEGNLDKYDLINVNGQEAIDMVYDVIENHYQNTFDEQLGQGEILDINKAAQAVEDHLRQQAERFLQARSFADRLRPQEKGEPQESTEADQAKPQPSPTLTNRQTASAAPPTQGEHFLSDEESKKAAAKFLQEQWDQKQA